MLNCTANADAVNPAGRVETIGCPRDAAGRFATADAADGIQTVILPGLAIAFKVGGMYYAERAAAARHARNLKAKADRLAAFHAEVDRMAQESAWQAAYQNGHAL